MRRITVSLDDALVEVAESDVAAGRAPSVSAWVAGAIRAKAQARAELIADFEELERRDPTPPAEMDALAAALGIAPAKVAHAVRRARPAKRRGRAR
jgi:Arc/MetJ-type ribon-helix-helix transcriptional regulator